ncbi:MAG: metallophosphoesterase family protein [Acidobacteriales bacterium]|nr:metallophosphoesterase family protein [Terriglobales bacterium]
MPRILVISDIHANLQALEACLNAAPAHDEVWNLGDVVGYGASPNETTAISRKIGNRFVRGNHDKACSGTADPKDFNRAAAQSAMWTRENLSQDNLQWLRDLPAGPILCSHSAQISHGSPLDEDHYLLDIADGCRTLELDNAKISFFGHTHVQGGFAQDGGRCYRISPDYLESEGTVTCVIELMPATSYLLNPGSIGQPRDGDPRAAFGVFEPDQMTMTYFRVPYDIPAAQQQIRDAGMHDWLAERLALGR